MAETGKTSSKTKKAAVEPVKPAVRRAPVKKKLLPDDFNEPLIFGLDIGTRSIVGTVGYKKDAVHFVVVAQVSVEHETRSMLDGQIHDIGAVAQTIMQVKLRLENLLERKLTDVCIAAAGRVLKTVTSSAQMDFNSETQITTEHIYSLDMLGVENAYEILRKEQNSDDVKFYCVGYSVMHYYQNDYPILNLEGHKANTIKLDMIATFLPDEVVDGLYAAVEKAGLYVANLTLEPIAAINVAIPEKFRLLNIALVDVGAGTSDISITSDGSIIAYGMIPAAGDEVTEFLAKHYLLDFGEADKLKCQSTVKKQVTYHDIMGLSHKVQASEIVKVVDGTVREITKQVAEKIKELNGGKSVSAVFVVGGGGKVGGFTETLAEYLDIPKERVALRGSEVMGNIEFVQKTIKADSLLVTPVGICLNYYEQRNNFIFVTINGDRIKLYDNNKLNVVDAALQHGFPNEDLFPKRGKSLNYTVNGEKRMRRGEAGEAAIVKVNGKESAMSARLVQNDKIEIIESTRGEDAHMLVQELPEYRSTMNFTFNKKQISCPRFVMVNGEYATGLYEIQENDSIEVVEFYTLEQVLEFMDISSSGKVYVNNALAKKDTKVYDNFSIACEIKKDEPNYDALMKEYGEGQVPEAVTNGEAEAADRLADGIADEASDAEDASGQSADEDEENSGYATEADQGAEEAAETGEEAEQKPNDAAGAEEKAGQKLDDTAGAGEKAGQKADGTGGAEEKADREPDDAAGAGEVADQKPEDTAGAEEKAGQEPDDAAGTEEKADRRTDDAGGAGGKAEQKAGGAGSGSKADSDGTRRRERKTTPVEKNVTGAENPSGVIDLKITVNGEEVILKNKKSYHLVDVLDFYPFDLSVMRGDDLATLINGKQSAFTEPLNAGDEVKIYWV